MNGETLGFTPLDGHPLGTAFYRFNCIKKNRSLFWARLLLPELVYVGDVNVEEFPEAFRTFYENCFDLVHVTLNRPDKPSDPLFVLEELLVEVRVRADAMVNGSSRHLRTMPATYRCFVFPPERGAEGIVGACGVDQLLKFCLRAEDQILGQLKDHFPKASARHMEKAHGVFRVQMIREVLFRD